MTRDRRWYGDRGHLFIGMAIGLVLVTPAFAMPPDLPLHFDDDTRLYTLIASGVLLFIALVLRMMRRAPEVESPQEELRGYGTRFFPADRAIALE